MQIKLAGFNVESEILNMVHADEGENLPLTPETFSSAYARISRSSKDVTALRQEAREDVHKARKSNQKIIFQMGHHSVAEHAVFNFDIVDVSRLALEEIEKFRLVSYTEKSQRYVTLDGDFILPREIDHPHSIQQFKKTIELQNAFYFKAFEILREYLFKKHPVLSAKRLTRKDVEGWAKEDARYILSLATQGQVGMTINARNLEHLFRRFALSHRQEVRQMGKEMYQLAEKIAPSLLLFPEPSTFEQSLADGNFKNKLHERVPTFQDRKEDQPDNMYQLKILDFSQDADDRILAAFLTVNNSVDYETAYETIRDMDFETKKAVFLDLFENMEFFDSPPREFELSDIRFQAVISASNFAQLKRHRMATLLAGDYDINLDKVVPENIKINGLENEFRDIIEQTEKTYQLLKERHGSAADYILTNAHCRRVVMKMNVRELYHFARLRADTHAQWDIRNLAIQLVEKVKERIPLASLLLCGKSDYVKQFEAIYHKKPTLLI